MGGGGGDAAEIGLNWPARGEPAYNGRLRRAPLRARIGFAEGAASVGRREGVQAGLPIWGRAGESWIGRVYAIVAGLRFEGEDYYRLLFKIVWKLKVL